MKFKLNVKTGIKSIYPVAFSRIFVPKIFCKMNIKVSVPEFFFSKIPWFNNILLNTYRRMRLYYESCSSKLRLQKPYCKKIKNETLLIIKNESCKCYLGNKNQKANIVHSWTKHIGTRPEFTNFSISSPLLPISMLKLGNF